ncbi:transketolase [Alphaproteobacteria bacterium]|nr:transketolase [Alphaproteobacteria bacterium]
MSVTITQIEKHAANMRRNIVRMISLAGSGHPAGALGLADIFAALYFEVLRYNPKNPADPDRDILVLSAGHTVPVQYAALAEAGLIPENELWTLRQFGSRLQGHPERQRLPWLETTSGPLGCGISQGAGMALSIKMERHPGLVPGSNQLNKSSIGFRDKPGMTSERFVYVVTGDGELDEGNNWEALMFAAKYRLGNLIAIVDRNNIQQSASTEEVMPLEDLHAKWAAFGWHVIEIDGNNVRSFIDACSEARAETDRPSVIIAHTIAGKGVDFMEGDYHWHGKAPDAAQAKEALEELR